MPIFYDTESDTFFDTKFFRYRIRNHQTNGKVLKPRSFETETSHSAMMLDDDWEVNDSDYQVKGRMSSCEV